MIEAAEAGTGEGAGAENRLIPCNRPSVLGRKVKEGEMGRKGWGGKP